MKLTEILLEKEVQSSWLGDLTNNRDFKYVIMTTGRGTAYAVLGISRHMFDRWHNAPSKGKFWHMNIKDKYKTVRVK
jgi:hypothetical protein